MRTDLLLDHFHTLVKTPEDAAYLEAAILDLAVRGQLVPQDPSDEPAIILRERNITERRRLEKKKEIRKLGKLAPVSPDEVPYDLPENWTWCRLGEVTTYGISDKVGPDDVEVGTWVLELKDIEKTTSRLLHKERFGEFIFKSTKSAFNKGDVLYGKLRPYLDKVVVADEDGVCTTEIIPLHGYVDIDPYYLRLCLKRPDFIEYANRNTYGMNLPRLNTQDARMALLPLAPLAEQKRIVARVDELLAQTRALTAQLQAADEALVPAAQATFQTFTDAPDQSAQQKAWQRISDAFDALTADPRTLDALKQTVLQLAVQGKLVPQDPSDEPASVLIGRIKTEKDQIRDKKGIRKTKPLPPIEKDQVPYPLPDRWEWAKLDDICYQITDGTHYTPTYVDSGVPFLSVKDISGGFIDFSDTRFITREEHEGLIRRCHPEFGDILLTKVGTTGIAKVVDTRREFSIFVSVALLKFDTEEIYHKYLEHLINSPFVKQQSEQYTMGVGNQNLVLKHIKNFLIPIPPLAEQKRIVAKVEALLALCDALTAEVVAAEEVRARLLQAVLNGD